MRKLSPLTRQLGVEDPKPYLNLASTYTQMGEFFAAALNVRTALDMRPDDANIYGRLGLVYHRSRNYESCNAGFLQCVVKGCDASVSCEVRSATRKWMSIVIEGPLAAFASILLFVRFGISRHAPPRFGLL